MGTLTMIYHPDAGEGKKYTSDGVTYWCKTIDSDDLAAEQKKGWCKHFSDFGKKPAKKSVKKAVKKAARKKK